MPRFNLREFSVPQYAGYIPENTVEERPAQKVADLLYFMHTLPWFSESEDEKKQREMKEKYEKDMEEYTPDLDAQDEMAKEAEVRHAENIMDGYTPDPNETVEPSPDVQVGSPQQMLDYEQDLFGQELEDARKKRLEGNKLGSVTGGNRGR